MKKRCLISAAAMAGAVCVAMAVLALLPERAGITKGNLDRLKQGMTKAEAESIFGGPPSDSVVIKTGHGAMVIQFDGKDWQGWNGPDGSAVLHFDAHGHLANKTWYEHERSFWQRLRQWLPWFQF